MSSIHYVYKITNLKNNKIYIGVRTHPSPDKDEYMSSSTIISKLIEIEGIENFKKEVLHTYSTRQEAEQKEKEYLTEEFCNDPDTYNVHSNSSLQGDIHGFRKDLWYDYYDTIRERYQNGEPAKELGKYYKCDTGTVRKIVEDIKRTRSETQTLRFLKYTSGNRNKEVDSRIDDIKKWYDEGVSLNQIGKRLGVKHGAIKARLEELGVDVRKSSKHTKEVPTNRKDIWEFREEIVSLYKEGKSLREIGNSYGCNPGVIKKVLVRYGIPIRSKKENVRYLKTSQILELHRQGYTVTEIQKITHTNFNIVKEIICQ